MASGRSTGSDCAFFKKGACNKGADCPFLHGGLPAAAYVAAVASGKLPTAGRPPTARPQSASRRRPAPQKRDDRAAVAGAALTPAGNSNGGQQLPSASSPSSARGGGSTTAVSILGNAPLSNAPAVRPPAFTGTLQLGGGLSAKVQVNVQQQKVLTKPPLVVHAYFLIDASGSMEGERMAATLSYVQHMASKVLSDEDQITIWTFNSEDRLGQIYYQKPAASIRLDELQARVTVGGTTRLYDNCVRAIASMRKDKGMVDRDGNTILRQLVVFTDGCDNASEAGGVEKMIAEVKAPGMPHFHFTVLAVGSDGKTEGAKLQMMLGLSRHCKVVIAEHATSEDIGKAFGRAQASLRQAKEELIETLTIISRSNSSQPAMSKIVHGGASLLAFAAGSGSPAPLALPAADSGGGGGGSAQRRSASASRSRSRSRRNA